MTDKPPAFLPVTLPSLDDNADAPPEAPPAPRGVVSPFDGPLDPSLFEIGDDFEATKQRIREIEAKALRMLRDPSAAAADDDDSSADE